MALASKNAALVIADKDAVEELGKLVVSLSADETKQEELHKNITKMAFRDAAAQIASEALELIKKE